MIRARVVDQDGLPVRDAEVWIGLEWGEGLSPAGRSGPDGRFEAPRPQKRVFVGARHPDHAPSLQIQVPEPKEAADSVELELELPGPGASCALTVLDPQSQPVEGARVRFGNTNPNQSHSSSGESVRPAPGWSARTGADGRVLATGLTPERIEITVDAPGFEPWAGLCALQAGEETGSSVTLSRGAAISGSVVDSENLPLEGASVWAGPREPHQRGVSTKSDSAGRYRLEGVPTGEIRIKAWIRDRGHSEEDLFVDHGEQVTWNVVLSANPSIRGQVLDEAGQPLVGWMATITAPGDRGHWIRNVKTDAEGRFELPDPPQDPVDLEVYRAGQFGGNDIVLVIPGVRSGDADLTVRIQRDQMPTAFITGKVLYSDGEPCSDAVVTYKASDLPNRYSSQTELDGSFRIGPVRPATYDLRVSENELSLEKAADVAARADLTVDLGEIRIARPGMLLLQPTPEVVQGSLTYHVAQPNENGQLVSTEFRFEPSREISLRPGEYVIEVRGTCYESERVSCRVESGGLTVLSVPLKSKMDLTLDFVARDAAPLKWVDFEIRGYHVDTLAHQARVTADEQGVLSARFELVPGIYKVSAVADNGYRGGFNAMSWSGPQTKPICVTLSGP
jgi:protocatechuate 3,4-dioxygenase beta subunit